MINWDIAIKRKKFICIRQMSRVGMIVHLEGRDSRSQSYIARPCLKKNLFSLLLLLFLK